MLDVDELEADRVRPLGRGDELVDQPVDLVVGQHRHAAGKALVEHRVAARGQRLGPVPHVRPREAAGVRQLQAEVEVAVGVGAEPVAMRGDELVAQRRPAPARVCSVMSS